MASLTHTALLLPIVARAREWWDRLCGERGAVVEPQGRMSSACGRVRECTEVGQATPGGGRNAFRFLSSFSRAASASACRELLLASDGSALAGVVFGPLVGTAGVRFSDCKHRCPTQDQHSEERAMHVW